MQPWASVRDPAGLAHTPKPLTGRLLCLEHLPPPPPPGALLLIQQNPVHGCLPQQGFLGPSLGLSKLIGRCQTSLFMGLRIPLDLEILERSRDSAWHAAGAQ